jgi:putative addiction module CopG family antidote
MRTTQQFGITLPDQMVDLVKVKVAIGEYATGSEVIRDGLRILMARDHLLERWLAEQVGSSLEALRSNPASALILAEVRARLAVESKKVDTTT